MKNSITIHVRRFPVVIKDERTGDIRDDAITLSKEQLQATQLVRESSTELIRRMYNRKGYEVLEIGAPDKLSVAADLDELWKHDIDEAWVSDCMQSWEAGN